MKRVLLEIVRPDRAVMWTFVFCGLGAAQAQTHIGAEQCSRGHGSVAGWGLVRTYLKAEVGVIDMTTLRVVALAAMSALVAQGSSPAGL